MTSRARAGVSAIAVVAVLLLVVALLLWRSAAPAEFGWFAYAPLGEPVEVPQLSLLTPRHGIALGVGAVGVALLGGAAGYTIGRRRPHAA